jgi:TPR repeat protein
MIALLRLCPPLRRVLTRRAIACLPHWDGRAARRLYAAAMAGEVDAALALGLAYAEGRGLPRDAAEAMHWLRRAAEAGQSEAQWHLAMLLSASPPNSVAAEPRQDPAQALDWALRAAETGHAESQALAAQLLEHGPAERRHEAADWYRRAAEGGSAAGALGHALGLIRGARNEQGAAAALPWLERAVMAELPAALHLLGTMREQGIGAPADMVSAAALQRRAAEAGLSAAQRALGRMMLLGLGVSRDPRRGEEWLRLAAKGGDAQAAALLARLDA